MSLNDAWLRYQRDIHATEAPAELVFALRTSFFAGVATLLNLITATPPGEPSPELVGVVTEAFEEVREMRLDLLAQVPPPQ